MGEMNDDINWGEVEALFQTSLNQPVDMRQQFIRTHAQHETIANQALQLLKAYENATSFMSTSVDVSQDTSILDAGEIVGSWHVEEKLGAGGMGEVYLVRRIGVDFVQKGALKLIRIADPIYEQRFHKERQLLASLEHANIGRLIDGGEGPDGRQFMVMEFVPGEAITRYAKTQNFSERQSIELFLQLTNAMAFAHRQQILHRDLKPDNVLVTKDGNLKLIDFGVAHIFDMDEQADAPMTIAYAAPEQLSKRPVSPATDIYGLGLILYELIFKKRYGRDEDVRFQGVHRDLKAILQKALQTHPQDRYHSVEDLADDLENYLKQKPVKARNASVFYRIERFVARQKLLSGISVIFAIAALCVGYLLQNGVLKLRPAFQKTPPVRTVLACGELAITIKEKTVATRGPVPPAVKILIDEVKAIQSKGDIVRAFAVAPDCQGGVITTDNEDFVFHKFPDSNWNRLEQALLQLRQNRLPVTAIAFNPRNWRTIKSFIITHKNGIHTVGLADPELKSRLETTIHSLGPIKSISYRPWDNLVSGWSFIGPRGFTYTRNVTEQNGLRYFSTLEKMKLGGFVADYNSFSNGSDGQILWVFGNQECEIGNFKTPRSQEQCDLSAYQDRKTASTTQY